MASYEDKEIGKHELTRPPWRPSESQRRDAARRHAAGARLLGPLPLERDADRGRVTIDAVEVPLTNLRKVFFPADGYTKRDLLEYTHDVAEFMLPYMVDKPYTLKRFPNGIDRGFFFQKEAGMSIPDWVKTVRIGSKGERAWINFVLVNDCPTLLYMVNLGCVDHNCWMSRAQTPDAPDFVLIDLDPGERADFATVVRVAQAIRRVVEEFEIETYPKTSGATGIHMFIPLGPGHTFEQTQSFAEILLRIVGRRIPEFTTDVWWVARRPKDKVFLDYRQNARGKTVPPPYSPRPHPGAPVSAPLLWKELTPRLDPSQFTIKTMRRRLERYGDLFAGAIPRPDGPRILDMLERIRAKTGMDEAEVSSPQSKAASRRHIAPRKNRRLAS